MKKIWILTMLLVFGCLTFPTFSQEGIEKTENNLHIIPKWSDTNEEFVTSVMQEVAGTKWENKWTLIDRYNEAAETIDKSWDLWTAFQTWIMSRNSLLNYVVYLMRFINQLGLLIWSIMILYAGYQYAWTIFKFWDPTKGKNAIKNAIIWILVIVFSYGIWKALESMFL